MAVDASLKLSVLYQGTLAERRQVALVDAHFAPHLIAWLYQAVADAVVDAVGADNDVERTIGVPTVFIFCGDGDGKLVATIVVKQFVPVVNIEVQGFVSLAVEAVAMTVGNDRIDKECFLVCHAEIERGNIYRDSDTNIVGIYLRLHLLLPCIADRFHCARGSQHKN